jgi:hypothetical protein
MYVLRKAFVALERSAAGRCYLPGFNWSMDDRFGNLALLFAGGAAQGENGIMHTPRWRIVHPILQALRG